MMWKCMSCGRTAQAHRCRLEGETQDCISEKCGGEMVLGSPKRLGRKGPPKLPRTGPYPGRCPVCLGTECEDPACARARGE